MILEGGQSAEGLCFCGWRKEGKMDGWMDGWMDRTNASQNRATITAYEIHDC